MPDDRFIHRRAGHSQKVNLLTDLEFRVWVQYMLSADDFGVMRGTHHPLQNDNDHLANRPAKLIQRCLEALMRVGLIGRFEHQGKPYVFQHDWQDWQKVEYPRGTSNPIPEGAALETCTPNTRVLFDKYPGGVRRARPERVPKMSQAYAEDDPTTRACAPAKRLTANGSGERLTADGERPSVDFRRAPLHDTSHRKHAHCGRVCLPASLFSEFVRRRNHPAADAEIRDWAMGVEREWADKPEETGDSFEFWKARYGERWPVAPAAQPGARRPAWAQKPAVRS